MFLKFLEFRPQISGLARYPTEPDIQHIITKENLNKRHKAGLKQEKDAFSHFPLQITDILTPISYVARYPTEPDIQHIFTKENLKLNT